MATNKIGILLVVLIILAVIAAIIFTGILSQKPHGKINLAVTIALLVYGIVFMIMTIIDKDTYYMSFETALVYGVFALAAWITENKVLKIIRMVLVCISALVLGYFLFVAIACMFIPDLSGLRGLG